MASSAFTCAVHRESTTSDHTIDLWHCKIVLQKVGCLYEIAIVYDKHALEETAWSTL